jgi:hypothetical protein
MSTREVPSPYKKRKTVCVITRSIIVLKVVKPLIQRLCGCPLLGEVSVGGIVFASNIIRWCRSFAPLPIIQDISTGPLVLGSWATSLWGNPFFASPLGIGLEVSCPVVVCYTSLYVLAALFPVVRMARVLWPNFFGFLGVHTTDCSECVATLDSFGHARGNSSYELPALEMPGRSTPYTSDIQT